MSDYAAAQLHRASVESKVQQKKRGQSAMALVELGRKEHQEALPTRLFALEGLACLIAKAVRVKGPLALLLHLRLGQQLRQAPAVRLHRPSRRLFTGSRVIMASSAAFATRHADVMTALARARRVFVSPCVPSPPRGASTTDTRHDKHVQGHHAPTRTRPITVA